MAAAGVDRFPVDGQDLLGLDIEEEQFLLDVAASVAAACLTHPLHTARTLMKLGHEPFGLYVGRTFTGREAYFLPDAFTYAKLLAEQHGWRVLWTAFDAAALDIVVEAYAARWTRRYIDAHFPEMGGKAEHEDEDERDLTDAQSFRRQLRATIRKSAARTVAVIVARPFSVLCIRQIAQLVGGEAKYVNVGQAFKLILHEEGWAGMMAGLMPQLCAELIVLWGASALTFAAERALARTEIVQPCQHVRRSLLSRVARYAVTPLAYPYTVVATVMACVGSGLAVSCLPYHPPFGHWQDCYEYLRNSGEQPSGLRRGANHLFRESSIESYLMNRLRRKWTMQVI